MLEGKALFVAVMMLTAAPIAATDEGQAFLGDITYDIGEMLDTDEEENKIIDRTLDDADIDNKELLLTDENLDVDCLTLGQWKEQFLPKDKEVTREEKDGARNGDSKETDEKKDDSDEADNVLDKKDWVDKDTVTKDDCLSAEEWTLKFESDRKEPCFTLKDLEKKMRNGKEDWNKDWHNNGERDWNEEWFEELKILAELCQEGDEEACEELLIIREELAEDREEEEHDKGEDGARGGEDDSDENDRDEENWEEIRAVIQELAEACEDGNEEACVELREMIAEMMDDREEKDRDRDEKNRDDKACLTMKEWKKVFNGGKDRKDGHDRDDNRKERVPHRDAFVREILEELEYACEEEGNEEACVELEEMIAEFEEREGDCNKERDDDESDEEDNHEDEDDESDENESDDEDESNEE